MDVILITLAVDVPPASLIPTAMFPTSIVLMVALLITAVHHLGSSDILMPLQ